MAARILDGKALSQVVKGEVKAAVEKLIPGLGRPPGLTVVLVGGDPASQVYVRNKEASARAAGIRSVIQNLPADVSERSLLDTIDRLNEDPEVDGILVQLPLPRHIDAERVLERIEPRKDVDGFHPVNVGLLAEGRPSFVPCTPLGIQRLLLHEGVETRGAHAVVVGRSNIVGKPMAMLLLGKGAGGDATVTVCHSGTRDLTAVTRTADLLIVAMGRPEAIGAEGVKPGAVVVDVGIHRRADGSLCGDVAYGPVSEVASAITPVPGGVGPMTVAMLLANTLAAARRPLER